MRFNFGYNVKVSKSNEFFAEAQGVVVDFDRLYAKYLVTLSHGVSKWFDEKELSRIPAKRSARKRTSTK